VKLRSHAIAQDVQNRTPLRVSQQEPRSSLSIDDIWPNFGRSRKANGRVDALEPAWRAAPRQLDHQHGQQLRIVTKGLNENIVSKSRHGSDLLLISNGATGHFISKSTAV